MIQKKHIFIALASFILICVLYYLFFVYPRQGKVAVEILVNPSDAAIYIDGKKGSSGKTYLYPGTHDFKAQKDGWSTAEVSMNISNEVSSVALLPMPASEEAKIEAENEAVEREGLAGIAANMRGLDIRNTTPILNELPYSNIAGPYKVDYGFNQDDKKTPYLIVSYSTPNGRQEAIKWLQDNDTDITTIEIIFEDFINPIQKVEHSHD